MLFDFIRRTSNKCSLNKMVLFFVIILSYVATTSINLSIDVVLPLPLDSTKCGAFSDNEDA